MLPLLDSSLEAECPLSQPFVLSFGVSSLSAIDFDNQLFNHPLLSDSVQGPGGPKAVVLP